MNEIYILGGLRSYIGVENGIYKNILPEDLGAEVLKSLIEKYNIKNIDEIICGNSIGTGGNITRLMALKAGISEEVPAFTVDMQCASSSKAIEIGYNKIKAKEANIIIVGGFESSSMKPLRIYNDKDYRSSVNNGKYNVAQFSPEEFGDDTTFKFGERVVEEENITEEELNYWSIRSHKKAFESKDILKSITLSINGSTKDEGIRKNISERLLNRLPKIIKSGKTNVGNISLTNDGAAFLVLCSEEYLKENNLKSEYKIKGTKTIGINPLVSPKGALKACSLLLEKENLSYEDISAFEFNEAFAAIDVMFQRKNPLLIDRYNIFGGALAYGHPYGASGAIIMLHLLKALEKTKGRYGVISIAASGGISMAILIERIKKQDELF
ncbi:MAG: acetyl-CoA C-acyltransferase [Clostridium sp.]|jgi:acetyl-CoA C-acetyltransferase|nr:acetyl-CoA C-acyltransferase [Clostridium sp.]